MRSTVMMSVGLALGIGVTVAAANVPDGYVNLFDMTAEEIITHCADAIEHKNSRGRVILRSRD